MEIPRWLALTVLVVAVVLVFYLIWRAKRKNPSGGWG